VRRRPGLGVGVDRAGPETDRVSAALAVLASHRATFRRAAQRVSICGDDADDALQRATEILLTKAPTGEHRRLVGWMAVVTRHEAIAVRRARERTLGSGGAAPDALLDSMPSETPGPLEAAERREALEAARRALAELKADHRRAIVLQAQGYSYAEIAERCGWTYTKVNRCLAEGRARLRDAG
jgi:RNA polymerase sigma factor (sigma-70 family)